MVVEEIANSAPLSETLITNREPSTNPTVISSSDTAQAMSPSAQVAFGQHFLLSGVKSFDSEGRPVDNSSDVYFGMDEDAMPYRIKPGETVNLTAPLSKQIDLNNWWMIGTADDAIYIKAIS